MNNSPNIPVEDRKYVLRFPKSRRAALAGRDNWKWYYYTGKEPTAKIHKAKTFSLKYAKAAKQFAHTTHRCEIKRVTQKMLFKAALKGK